MPEIVLKGTAGPPTIRREGTAIVVKKRIWGASVEERTPATRLAGKQTLSALHTTAELKATMKMSSDLANTYVTNAATAATLAGNQLSAKQAAEMKVAVKKIAHLTNKLISAKEEGITNTAAWTRMRGELRTATKELKEHTDKAKLKKANKEQKEKHKLVEKKE